MIALQGSRSIKAIGKKELMYNKNVSEKVQALSERLETDSE